MKVVILCGGLGTRLREETEYRPKPMVPIGSRPILWHIMKTYAYYGHKEFILCLGYKGEVIKDYFRNYHWNTSDVTLRLGRTPKITYHSNHDEEDWSVTLVDTGQETQTGGRLRRVLPFIESDSFLFTYGDGLTNSNINESIKFHEEHGSIATVTAVKPTGRFGELAIDGQTIVAFKEKPEQESAFISGGYFVLNKTIGNYLENDTTVLEQKPLETLTRERQLKAFCHQGFWQCMDTYREQELLNKMWNAGKAPWKICGKMFAGFYQGKRVLVTGHTGFKGSWLSLWLKRLGAEVIGYALPAPINPSFYEIIQTGVFATQEIADVRDSERLEACIASVRPDLIFHLAAQPLVRLSYEQPRETFETNVLGTIHLLEAVRKLRSDASVIVVTSDKCYENRGWEFGYRENDPLGGHDVYSSSKAACEIAVQSWQRSFFSDRPKIVSARAGNVVGGGDYATDRIVPDAIRALIAGAPIPVRNPNATRPWQHVLDCLSGYLWLGACVRKADTTFPTAFNFGPGIHANVSVSKLVEEMLGFWPGEWKFTGKPGQPHEAHHLNLAIDRAATVLQWFPTWDFSETIRYTVSWYHERHLKAGDMLRYSLGQIEDFEKSALKKKTRWAVVREL